MIQAQAIKSMPATATRSTLGLLRWRMDRVLRESHHCDDDDTSDDVVVVDVVAAGMFDAKRAGCVVVVVDPLGEPPNRFRRLAVVVWLPPLCTAVAVLPASAPPGLMLRWWFIMMRFIMAILWRLFNAGKVRLEQHEGPCRIGQSAAAASNNPVLERSSAVFRVGVGCNGY